MNWLRKIIKEEWIDTQSIKIHGKSYNKLKYMTNIKIGRMQKTLEVK